MVNAARITTTLGTIDAAAGAKPILFIVPFAIPITISSSGWLWFDPVKVGTPGICPFKPYADRP